MKGFLKKYLIWVIVALALLVAAVIFIRPQRPFAGDNALTVEQVTAYGQDVTGETAEYLPALLADIRVSRMMDGAEGWDESASLVITGTCNGESYTLVLGDYNALILGRESYRVKGGSDLMLQILELAGFRFELAG